MLQLVLVPDVDEDRQFGFDYRDIGIVLVRSDTEVHSTFDSHAVEQRQDFEISGLVRDEVVGIEVSFWLGEEGGQAPEFGIGNLRQEKGRNEKRPHPHEIKVPHSWTAGFPLLPYRVVLSISDLYSDPAAPASGLKEEICAISLNFLS